MSISILGGGAFGSALAVALGEELPVTLWARDASGFYGGQIPRLPGATLPASVTITDNLEQACEAGILLLAVPMQALSGLLNQIGAPLTGKALVACCKGMDIGTLSGPTAVIHAIKPDALPALLTGPSFATDLSNGLPTALTLACADETCAKTLQARLTTRALRLYRSSDTTGAELGGALKNVIAIACGACIGLGQGESARAALMTRGFAEMTRLALRLGGRADTLAGLSGLGDLSLTCSSPLSRNFRYGLALGEGVPFDPDVTVEGASTALAANALAQKLGLDLPITEAVADITGQGLPVEAAMRRLLTRPLKEE